MQIIIKSRQMQVPAQLRQKIERKVQRLSRLVDENSRVEVTVTEEQTRSAQDRFSVQLALSGCAHPIHSEVSALNASTALDLVIDKVVTQLGRQKDRQKTARHRAVPVRILALSRSGELSTYPEEDAEQETSNEDAVPAVQEAHNEEIWSRVLEIRRLPTAAMTDQEVIEHMEREGVAFYPFFNEETNSVNVMYRLAEGGYGLLVPAVESVNRDAEKERGLSIVQGRPLVVYYAESETSNCQGSGTGDSNCPSGSAALMVNIRASGGGSLRKRAFP